MHNGREHERTTSPRMQSRRVELLGMSDVRLCTEIVDTFLVSEPQLRVSMVDQTRRTLTE